MLQVATGVVNGLLHKGQAPIPTPTPTPYDAVRAVSPPGMHYPTAVLIIPAVCLPPLYIAPATLQQDSPGFQMTAALPCSLSNAQIEYAYQQACAQKHARTNRVKPPANPKADLQLGRPKQDQVLPVQGLDDPMPWTIL